MASNDAADFLHLLDSADLNAVEQIKELILENLRANKEAWMLNAVVDFFLVSHSQRCLEILETIREPHDKQLFDRLSECIKGQHKLPAITVLGHLINKPPPWLHKITSHSFMSNVIKVMKTEVDVPILVSAVLAITSLLPLVPVSVESSIPEIMDAFSRLAAFNFKKPGNVPDVYLMHLHVAIYSLFHRMHGMFPCHLVFYLRSYYSKKENRTIFESTIAPMLERVRMHPLLITSSKEKEVSRERWRHKEVHDIITDCAQLSLDLIEGSTEKNHCPFSEEVQHPQLASNTDDTRPSGVASCFTQSIINSADIKSSMWSPSVNCGLSTPPPGAFASSSSNVLDGGTLSQRSTARNTPHVHESPLPTGEPLTPIQHQQFEPMPLTIQLPPTPGAINAADKRLSAMSLSLSGKIPPSTPTASDLVPPSPLKFETCAEPPLHAQKMQAIRKLSFQKEEQSNEGLSKVSKELDSVPSISTSDSSSDKIKYKQSEKDSHHEQLESKDQPSPASGRRKPPPLKCLRSADTFDFGGEDIKAPEQDMDISDGTVKDGELSQSVPSINQLPDIIDSLHRGNLAEMGSDDEEVQELTGSRDTLDDSSSEDSQIPSSSALTAQSVQAFMKNANRIRFNSMNAGKLREMSQEAEMNSKRARSNSCPDFEADLEVLEERVLVRRRQRSNSSSESASSSLSETTTIVAGNAVSGKPATTPTKVSTVSFTEPVITEEDEEITVNVYPDETDGKSEKEKEALQNFRSMFPYHHLFPLSLPAAPYMKCYNCIKGTKPDLVEDDHSVPLFMSYSPPDLLDRHLKLSADLHAQQVDALDSPDRTSSSVPHFGGVLAFPKGMPPANENRILRGEIHLLHNQVMYERQKRELYAKRNRRLLGRITKATALEEQNSAMQDQLRLQENEIQKLQLSVRLQQKEMHELKHAKERVDKECQELQKSLKKDVDKLQNDKHDLQSVLDGKLKENGDLKRDLQSTKSQLFNVIQEQNSLQVKADFALELQEQVARLNKELLLMGELQQKYQQRLVASATMHNPKPEMQFILETYKHELSSTKASLDQKTVGYEALLAYRNQQDDVIANKETIVTELRKRVEEGNTMSKAQLDAVEDRYRAQQKINAALEGQILKMRAELEAQKRPVPQMIVAAEDSGTGACAGAESVSGSSDVSVQSESLVEEARECRETPPSDLSPMSPSKPALGVGPVITK